jgi:hypothetical protein
MRPSHGSGRGPVLLPGRRSAGRRCACLQCASHRRSVVWLRGSSTSLLSHHPSAGYPNPLGLAGDGGHGGDALPTRGAIVAGCSALLSCHASDTASFCTGVPHGSVDGGHGCGLLPDARWAMAGWWLLLVGC